jgi:hypothetical protein
MKFALAVIIVIGSGVPALSQSFDPDAGTGNIVPDAVWKSPVRDGYVIYTDRYGYVAGREAYGAAIFEPRRYPDGRYMRRNW